MLIKDKAKIYVELFVAIIVLISMEIVCTGSKSTAHA